MPTYNKRKIITAIVSIVILVALLVINTLKKKYDKQPSEKTVKRSSNIDSIALLSFGRVAKNYHTRLAIEWDKDQEPDQIIYGNKDFGYFSSKDFSLGENISFRVLPFTFKKPIEFCIKYKNGEFKWAKSKLFKNPSPPLIQNIGIKVEGNFSNNFFLMSAQFVPNQETNQNRSNFPIIVNKEGEIIWGHLPNNGKTLFRKYPTIKPLGDGHYGIMFGEKYSYFERFDILGNIKEQVFPKMAQDPYVIHHDFIYLGENKLLTLGHKIHYVRNLSPFTDQIKEKFSALSRPKSFLSTTVEYVDLLKNKNKTIWDPISFINPTQGIPWSRNKKHAQKMLNSNGKHFSIWGENPAQIDWTHANSIAYYPSIGILVSMRNLSKVVLLDEKSFDVLWSLGNDPSDTYQTLNEKNAFYHQHHVQLLPDGTILMMDNHTSPPAKKNIGSRVSIYGLNKKNRKAQIIWNYQPKNKIFIGNRGSSYLLKNNNILAFYPVSLNLMDNLIEIDKATGQPIAHMGIYFTDVKRKFSDKQLKQLTKNGQSPLIRIREGGGNRVVPISELGKEVKIDNIVCKSGA